MESPSRPLQNKVALVTGAGRGIGRAIALAYAQAGAAVCCAARTQSEIDSTVTAISTAGGRGLAITADVTNLDAVTALFQQTVDTFGGLDIVVINAGANLERNPIETSDPAAWQATIDLNLNGAYFCARAAIPYLRARGGGKIITIGSGLGHRGVINRAAYACAKAGLWMLTRVLAQEVWQDKISVNELIPGPVDTSLTASRSPDDAGNVFNIDSEWVKGPDDVVPLAMFLATQPDIGPTAQSFSLMRRDN